MDFARIALTITVFDRVRAARRALRDVRSSSKQRTPSPPEAH